MKNLQFNLYQYGAGRVGLGLKSLNPPHPHPAPWYGAKILPNPCPLSLQGRENSCRAKRKETGQAGRSKIVIPNYHLPLFLFLFLFFFSIFQSIIYYNEFKIIHLISVHENFVHKNDNDRQSSYLCNVVQIYQFQKQNSQ